MGHGRLAGLRSVPSMVAKRGIYLALNQAFDDTPEASSESSERKDPKERVPLSFLGSAPEAGQ